MATLLPNGKTQFIDSNGAPLVGGSVYFYVPGTTTPKDTYQDSGQTILNTNPVVLDSRGQAVIFGSGSYRQVVKDSLGNLIWDQLTSGSQSELVNAQSGTAYTVQAGDLGKLLTFANASAIAVTLPQATGAFGAGWFADFSCLSSSAGSVTVTPTTSTINGQATLVLPPGASVRIISDGTQFQITNLVMPPLLRSYLAGLTLSNDGTTPNTKLDVSVGVCTDDTNVVSMSLASGAIDFTTIGADGLDTGSLANNTWYHCFAIGKADGTAKRFASTSLTPTLPSGYIYKRRLGSVKTDGSAHILAFNQTGDKFEWRAPVLDVNASTPTNGVQNTIALTVPPGISVEARLTAQALFVSGSGTSLFVYPTFLSTVPTLAVIHAAAANNTEQASLRITTNTSAQILTMLTYGASTTYSIETLGWVDRRGRDA